MSHSADVIVAGLGAMGSAALYQLAKCGVKVLGIDQFTPPHDMGSSHGETRITRKVVGHGAEYTPLALRSHEIWRELEQETKQSLLTVIGGLIVKIKGGPSAHAVTQKVAQEYNIRHEILLANDMAKRFPQFRFQGDEVGYYEYDAGFLRPELCVGTQLSLAQKLGAQVRLNERIVKFDSHDGSIAVLTDRGTYTAQKLIMSAGPWIGSLLPSYAKLFKPCRQILCWFGVEGDITPFRPENMPIFDFELADDNSSFYGFPAIGGKGDGLKVATENYYALTDPDAVERKISDDEIRDVHKYVQIYLPKLSNQCLRSTTCLYTMAPDNEFIIDFLPENSNVIIASPCSGRGFKYSAAIGEVLAEMALRGKSTIDVSKFSLSRFGV